MAAPEPCLGVADRGIFGDLDPQVQLELPAGLSADRVRGVIDREHGLLVLVVDAHPRKVYPATSPPAASCARVGPGGNSAASAGTPGATRGAPPGAMSSPTTTTSTGHAATALAADQPTLFPRERPVIALRRGDHAELHGLVDERGLREGTSARDLDDDGIPDPLDILIGAKKTVLNADAYTDQAQGYLAIPYPGGDVDRTIGVCTDVIIRAVRNAGLDLQREVHRDIQRRRAAYPMIRRRPDANIDHRRVGTLLPYFLRHWQRRSPRLDDPADPLLPGDILFMDTFPSRSGPDHVGIVSDRSGPSGLPLVINNWTNGTVTAEMDLLSFVPVLYRFRLPA